MMPDEELFGEPISGALEITGLARFPDHVFYLYPARCTEALGALDEIESDPRFPYYDDDADSEPNYLVLRDGPIAAWVGDNAPCPVSRIYALARDIATGLDLDAMTPAARHAFFDDDSRLFRSKFEFMSNPPYAAKGSPLKQVDEVLRALAITPEELTVVLESSTYSFTDGTTQTLMLAHTRRPPLPFRPLKPAKVTKYADTYAKWLARRPAEPPPAPRLPDGAEAPESDTPTTTATDDTGDATGGTGGGTTAQAAAPPVEPTPPATPTPPAPAPAPPPTPVAPAPAPTLAPSVPQDMPEEPDTFAGRAWPLGAAIAAGLAVIAGLALARRRR